MTQPLARTIFRIPAGTRRNRRAFAVIFFCAFNLLISFHAKSVEHVFSAQGIVRGLDWNEKTISIQHGAISNFMAAMTMPFNVKDTNEFAGLGVGDEISFQLHTTDSESWIGHISKTGTALSDENKNSPNRNAADAKKNPLWFCKFTNELGQAVSLNDFHGQALAVTFIYTRCPLPDACQRLSKNFQVAEQKLESMTHLPPNWHFISFSFDPGHDTPDVLKSYGELYNYDPAHWSFLTGAPDKIAELTRLSEVKLETDNSLINHNFRTLIVDAGGHLQTIFPISGDFSESIVTEMIKAIAVTNRTVSKTQGGKSL